jgi:hypothetical protein
VKTEVALAKEYYECHVTVDRPSNPDDFNTLAQNLGWKTSCIDGDPVLGKKVFFYFTCHGTYYGRIYEKMELLASMLGDRVVRKKIEQIIYDTKGNIAP